MTNYGTDYPAPRVTAAGWAIPLGITATTDDNDLTTYTAHEVVAQTLFQHDIEAAIAASELPDGDYSADIHAALRHGIRLQRAAEYPPAVMYLDGVAKGDQKQIDDYFAACLAVKAKYPFPVD